MKRYVALTWLLLMASTHAASFDCSKAGTKVEHIICDNAELSKLDENLSKAYSQALMRPDVKQNVIDSQRQWLKNSRNICQTVDCVRDAYQNRISELGITSSFGIVFLRPSGASLSQPAAANVDGPQTAKQPVESPQIQAVNSSATKNIKDCGIDLPLPEVVTPPASKEIMRLAKISQAKFDQQNFECGVQILEHANKVIHSVPDGAERAAMGNEIKDVALGVIRQNTILKPVISDPAVERRLVLAAIQSANSNGKLLENASEDERFNDAAFLGWVSSHYNIKMRPIEYRKIDLISLCLNYSLPAKRRVANKWRLTNFLAEPGRKGYLAEVAELLEFAQGDVLPAHRAEFERGLGSVFYGRQNYYHKLMAVEQAREDTKALTQLLPRFSEISWGHEMYLYQAEAYWQSGNPTKAREHFEKARDLVQHSGTAIKLLEFLCNSSSSCPFGIYDANETNKLFDEIEKLAPSVREIEMKMDKIKQMRKRISTGVSR